MAWICQQEGIDADPEALAILAAAGEGSVRDSLSALDQAIACCGAKLDAAEVRALLGAFSLESLEKVTQALAAGDSRSMLEVVDELERNGQNLQHFSRELSRYFRNLLVTRVAGRGYAAGGGQRRAAREVGRNRGQFLGRGPDPLSAALARSLQGSASLAATPLPPGNRPGSAGAGRPPAAHRAGAGGSGPAPRTAPSAPPALPPPAPSQPAPPRRRNAAPRTGPSPFELDRAKKAGTRPPEPQSSGANALRAANAKRPR